MRRTAFFLLLATAAAPAIAAQATDADREARREAARAERADRAAAREERQAERLQRSEESEQKPERSTERNEGERAAARVPRREAIEERAADRQTDRNTRAAARDQRRENAENLREIRHDQIITRRTERHTPPIVSTTPREGTQPPAPVNASNHRSSSRHWNSDWRKDRRYNWHNWRNRHRSLFRLGYYYDPFGWGYRPYSIGWRLWPSYFGSSYWLNDPWMYRLPPAFAGQRWIRYYDDALLVDTFTGEVVDVIHNFFW